MFPVILSGRHRANHKDLNEIWNFLSFREKEMRGLNNTATKRNETKTEVTFDSNWQSDMYFGRQEVSFCSGSNICSVSGLMPKKTKTFFKNHIFKLFQLSAIDRDRKRIKPKHISYVRSFNILSKSGIRYWKQIRREAHYLLWYGLRFYTRPQGIVLLACGFSFLY